MTAWYGTSHCLSVSHWPGPMLNNVAQYSSYRSAESRARVYHVTNMGSHVCACQTFSLADSETKTILNMKPNLTTLSNWVNEPSDVIIVSENVWKWKYSGRYSWHTKCRLIAGYIMIGLLVRELYCGRPGRALKIKYSPMVNIYTYDPWYAS